MIRFLHLAMESADTIEFNDPVGSFVSVRIPEYDLDLRFHAIDSGSKTFPVMLLLHGYGVSFWSFRNQISEFSKHFRVVVPDLPGFGYTERPPVDRFPYTIDSLLVALRAFVSGIQIDDLVIVGNSLGGGLGLMLALDRTLGKRIRKLILIDPAALSFQYPSYRLFGSRYETFPSRLWGCFLLSLPFLPAIGRSMTRAALKMYYASASNLDHIVTEYKKTTAIENTDFAAGYLRPWLHLAASINMHISDEAYMTRFEDTLRELTIPTIVLHGESDNVIPIEATIRLSEILRNASLHKIPDSSHAPHEEQPEMVNKLIWDFLLEI